MFKVKEKDKSIRIVIEKGELIPFVEQVLKELDIAYIKLWQHQANDYVVYDYEPWHSDNYYIMYDMEPTTNPEKINKQQFLITLLKSHVDKIKSLNQLI